eukprot:GHVS01092228.1.p1 GENE.GHVS01092228.1~~GHVS01092228.1.p1  ORF type:complete len:291 (-),score=47.21 GHVS01092228.1:83-955(-)
MPSMKLMSGVEIFVVENSNKALEDKLNDLRQAELLEKELISSLVMGDKTIVVGSGKQLKLLSHGSRNKEVPRVVEKDEWIINNDGGLEYFDVLRHFSLEKNRNGDVTVFRNKRGQHLMKADIERNLEAALKRLIVERIGEQSADPLQGREKDNYYSIKDVFKWTGEELHHILNLTQVGGIELGDIWGEYKMENGTWVKNEANNAEELEAFWERFNLVKQNPTEAVEVTQPTELSALVAPPADKEAPRNTQTNQQKDKPHLFSFFRAFGRTVHNSCSFIRDKLAEGWCRKP